jgi:hypothetical protein
LPFSAFVALEHRERWSLQFRNMMDLIVTEKLALALTLTRPDRSVFTAHLDCQCRELGEAPALLMSITETVQS